MDELIRSGNAFDDEDQHFDFGGIRKIPKNQRRFISLDSKALISDERTIDLSVSSDFPYQRWWYYEILDHSPECVDLSRMNDGAMSLYNHNRDDYLGVIEKAWLEDGKLYNTIKFDDHELAEKIVKSINSGIIKNVSIGYMVHELELFKKNEEGLDTYRVTSWTPFESSFVTVPADASVGVGRQYFDAATIDKPLNGEDLGERIIDKNMEIEVQEQDLTQERQRSEAIFAAGQKYNCPDLAQRAVREGWSIEQLRSQILDQGDQQKSIAAVQPVDPLGLSHNEQKSYSICRAITAFLNKDWKEAGFEKECHDEIAKRSGVSAKGFLVPVRDLKVGLTEQRAPYAVGTPPFGGNLVQTDLMAQDFIDILRNRAAVMRLGATMLSGLQGNVAIPRQNAATTTYWVAENGAITQSEATFDQITLTPKTIAARSQFSRLMLLQSSIDIEQFVRMDFAKVIALGIDDAALNGSGTGGVPRGIRNTPGIGSVALGVNGGVPTWAAVTQLETEVAQDNADIGEMGYLTNAKARGKLKNTLKSASTVSEFIWQDTQILDGMGMVNGYKALSSNQVPSNLTKGTGTNLSALFFGCWSQLLIGEWGILEILPNEFGAGYNSGAIDIRVMQTLDISNRYPEAFAISSDVITT
jgi:HK97 family phage major capsid protein/HK97 family phage prohead protease